MAREREKINAKFSFPRAGKNPRERGGALKAIRRAQRSAD